MNYEEARVYLDNVAKYGSVLGLESIRTLLERLGNPQNDLRFIHLAGTNGKGSVLAFLSTILKEAGYRVGRYCSPTLFAYRERIQVNEEYIEKEAYARLTTRIRGEADRLEQEGITLTAFEIETALAFLYFKEKMCDIVVLETGMGGDQDATNVVTTTILEVITAISLDHLGVLGNNLKEIAACKAGIIKEGTTLVTLQQKPDAMEVLLQTACERRCRIRVTDESEIRDVRFGFDFQSFSYKKEENLVISLLGTYQIQNAALAVEAVHALREMGFDISEDALRQGMRHTVWRGRFTLLRKEPLIFMDGAHNEDAALCLRKTIEQYFKGRKLCYITGVFQDKEYEKIIRIMAPYARKVTVIETPGNPRALKKELYCQAWEPYVQDVRCADSIKEAVRDNLDAAEKEDIILAFGSLSFLGEFEKAVKIEGDKK